VAKSVTILDNFGEPSCPEAANFSIFALVAETDLLGKS
jgi:hypothetical protein